MVKDFNSGFIKRQDLLTKSNKCKIVRSYEEGKIDIVLKYSGNTLSVFFREKDKVLVNCANLAIEGLDGAYLSFSAVDSDYKCNSEFSKVAISSDVKTNYKSCEKEEDKGKICYQDKKNSTQKHINYMKRLEKKFQKKRENAKYLSTGLLEFADMTEAEIKDHHKISLGDIENDIDFLLENMENEAYYIQELSKSYSNSLTKEHRNYNNGFDQILEFISGFEKNYDEMDLETEKILSEFKKLKVDSKVLEMSTKAKKLVEKLGKIHQKTQKIKTHDNFDFDQKLQKFNVYN